MCWNGVVVDVIDYELVCDVWCLQITVWLDEHQQLRSVLNLVSVNQTSYPTLPFWFFTLSSSEAKTRSFASCSCRSAISCWERRWHFSSRYVLSSRSETICECRLPTEIVIFTFNKSFWRRVSETMYSSSLHLCVNFSFSSRRLPMTVQKLTELPSGSDTVGSVAPSFFCMNDSKASLRFPTIKMFSNFIPSRLFRFEAPSKAPLRPDKFCFLDRLPRFPPLASVGSNPSQPLVRLNMTLNILLLLEN